MDLALSKKLNDISQVIYKDKEPSMEDIVKEVLDQNYDEDDYVMFPFPKINTEDLDKFLSKTKTITDDKEYKWFE